MAESKPWGFAKAVFSHWIGIVGGSAVFIIATTVLPQFGIDVPKYCLGVGIFLAVVWGCYRAWKDEHRKGEALTVALVQPKPIIISPLPPKKISQHTAWKYEIQVAVSNENQSINGVKVKLVKVYPPFKSSSGDYDFSNADQLQLLDGAYMNRKETVPVRLFTVYRSSEGLTIDCQSGPAGLHPSNAAHLLTFEASAVGVATHTILLEMKFSADQNEPAATLSAL